LIKTVIQPLHRNKNRAVMRRPFERRKCKLETVSRFPRY
jgi:hypothetical protein